MRRHHCPLKYKHQPQCKPRGPVKQGEKTNFAHVQRQLGRCQHPEMAIIPLLLEKEPDIDEHGNHIYDHDGKQVFRCGFRVGGGIDQDPSKSPQGYPDKGIYITFVYEGGPAHRSGLQVHDKILQVNGHDMTVVTHKKAIEYIKRKPVLNLLVYRKGVPALQKQPAPLGAPPPQQGFQGFQNQYQGNYSPAAQHSPQPQFARNY